MAPFWTDGICINQANEKEKEDQIALMAEIYAKASRVVVWLGEAKDDSDRALEEYVSQARTPQDYQMQN